MTDISTTSPSDSKGMQDLGKFYFFTKFFKYLNFFKTLFFKRSAIFLKQLPQLAHFPQNEKAKKTPTHETPAAFFLS